MPSRKVSPYKRKPSSTLAQKGADDSSRKIRSKGIRKLEWRIPCNAPTLVDNIPERFIPLSTENLNDNRLRALVDFGWHQDIRKNHVTYKPVFNALRNNIQVSEILYM